MNSMKLVLDTSEKYFDEILTPEVKSYFDSPSSFRSAFNVARSLFHYHEWLYEDRRLDLQKEFEKQFSNKVKI
jgi:hypothetical protein